MSDRVTYDELRAMLVSAAGEASKTDVDSEFDTVDLYELGYDSLALYEMGAHIKQRFGVVIPDEEITTLRTLRMIRDRVNELADVPA